MKRFICHVCGYVGRPKSHTRGSLLLEILLWLIFLIPGIIYSLWRLSTRQKVCPKCLTPNMIPEDTPKGQELLKKAAPVQS